MNLDSDRSDATRWARPVVLAVLLALVVASVVRADEVVSKGTRLHGKVTAVSSKGLTLEPEYGTGSIVIGWEDVEDLSTDGDVQFLYGEEDEIIAPVRGKRDGFVMAGEREVDVTTITMGRPIGVGGPTWRDDLRRQFRYWTGNFDLGFNYQQSTTDTTGLLINFATTRSKGPLRLIFGSSYRYGTEKQTARAQSTTQDELKGLIRGEYDFTPRIYGFGHGDLEYDGIERVSLRAVPKLGAGYVIWSEELDAKRSNFLKAELGGGWVYQKYFGGATDDYLTVAFGALACYHLPYGSKFDWRFDYLPAVDDWANNYLLRNNASLTVPVVDPLSAKFSVIDEYNNQPAPGAARNSLFITIGLSLGW